MVCIYRLFFFCCNNEGESFLPSVQTKPQTTQGKGKAIESRRSLNSPQKTPETGRTPAREHKNKHIGALFVSKSFFSRDQQTTRRAAPWCGQKYEADKDRTTRAISLYREYVVLKTGKNPNCPATILAEWTTQTPQHQTANQPISQLLCSSFYFIYFFF